MTLSPLGVRVSLVLTGLSHLHFSPRSCTSSPDFDTQDRIYCVPWFRRDKFTNRRYVDKATWREAFDHEAFHPAAVQGRASRIHGPSPLGRSVPRGLFPPGDKGVDRPIRQGMGTGMKLAENSWLCIRDSVIEPAHNPGDQPLLCAPWAGRRGDRTERGGCNRQRPDSARRAGVGTRPGGSPGAGRAGRSGCGVTPGAGCRRRRRDDPFRGRTGRGGRAPARSGDGSGAVRSRIAAVRSRRRRCTAQAALPYGSASGMLRETSRALCAGLGSGGVAPYPWG